MRFFQKNHGIITVFVTMIMVPVVVFTGMFVDLARYKLCSSQAVMAADSYGEVVLSEYDNVLKELYGLFSVTQNEEGLQAIQNLAEYTSYSFDPSADDNFSIEGFMPYADADVKLEYTAVEGASLGNNNVLLTQISDFMQYRIIEEVLDESGILASLEHFSSLDADMDTMERVSDIGTNSTKALGKIDSYYQTLTHIKGYVDYQSSLNFRVNDYSQKLSDICGSKEYADYVYYLEHKTEIDNAVEKAKRIEQAKTDEEETTEILTEEEQALTVRFVDVDDYTTGIKNALETYANAARNYDSEPIDFNSAGGWIDDLKKQADNLSGILGEIEEQVTVLKSRLAECSQDVQDGIREEVKELENIAKLADDFKDTYDKIQTVNDDNGKNIENKKIIEDTLDGLDAVMEKLLTGEMEPASSGWSSQASFVWYDFMTEKSDFYNQLKQLCTGTGGEGDKNAADKKIEEADGAIREAEKEMNEEEEPKADLRDISENLASELKISESDTVELPDITDYFSGGISINGAGSAVVDRFLLASYDFGMFSSRVTGIRESEEESSLAEEKEPYVDYSLTNVPMTRDINYLYGSELEYLFGGHNTSKDNLNETRNIICGVRLTMNFVSTYTIKQIDRAVKTAANAAATAVTATGVGAAAAPLVRVAVSGALRMGISAMESAADWKLLKNRESVPLLKRNLDELSCDQALLTNLVGAELSGEEKKDSLKIELSYEDYLYVLMYLCVDTDMLLSRTSTLITLNVNQSQKKVEELTSLDFKMEDTVTAISSTCKVKMDFVVVPDNFVEMFLSGTTAENVMSSMENRYAGYSIIRGY